MIRTPSLAQRLILCFVSAVLVWFAFPNFICKSLTPPTAFLAWAALIPFFIALHQSTPRQGALLGFLFGFSQFGGILYWIGLLEAAQYLSWLGWFVLVFYLSLYFLAFGYLYRWLDQNLGGGVWIAPFLWVALEFIRGTRPLGGFSWGEIGYSQAPYPAVLVFTSWGGVYGLTFLIVWFNGWLAQWMLGVLEKPSAAPPADWKRLPWPLIVLAIVLVWGILETRTTPLRDAGTVALLQPSINQDEKWSKENETATFDRLHGLVRGLRGTRPDLVVWPETAAPDYLLWSPQALKRVVGIVRGSKTDHLVGCLDSEVLKGGRRRDFNAAVYFNPRGKPKGVYHKRHLVPYGEYVPFQKYLTFLGPVVGDLGNFDAGDRYEKFQAGGFSYTPMICYEVIFPGDVYQAFRTGAEALVNISNDAWYGRTASAYQHAMMAVVRSAEERKPLLRASNSGICLATDPFGRVLASTRLFEVTTLTAGVFLTVSPSRTLYSLLGNWFPRFCWIMVLFWGAWVFVKRWRQNKAGPQATALSGVEPSPPQGT